MTARYRRWRHAFVHAVHASRKGLSGVAADLDQSPSELSRRLSDAPAPEGLPLRDEDMIGIIESTGDLTPVYWLIERFLQDPSARKEAALAAIASMAPVLAEYMEQAGITAKRGKR